MRAVVGFVVGLMSLAAGVSILLDLRGFGNRLSRLSLYTGAPIWKKDARPASDDVDDHRVMVGVGVTVVGLVIVIISGSILV